MSVTVRRSKPAKVTVEVRDANGDVVAREGVRVGGMDDILVTHTVQMDAFGEQRTISRTFTVRVLP